MFVAALVVLGLWNGVLGSETACQVLAEKPCRMDTIPPEELPGTYDKLMAECRNLDEVKQCIKDSVNKCMEEGSGDITVDKGALERLKENQRMLKLTTEICQDNSPLHNKFAQDMYCFKQATITENLQNTCSDYHQRVLSTLKSRIDMKLKNVDDYVGRHPIHECLNVLSDFNCYLSIYNDKCGSRAKDTALEIIERVASLDSQCPNSIRVDMLELIDAWNSVSKRGVYIRDLIISDI